MKQPSQELGMVWPDDLLGAPPLTLVVQITLLQKQ